MSSTSHTRTTRIAIGGILHETHTFMDQPTTLSDFEEGSLYRGGDLLREMDGTRSGIGGMIEAASGRGWQLLPTIYATAMPAGTVTGDAYQMLLTDLLDRLREALPVDGVLLALHGAMVAEGQLDVEADIVTRVRGIVGVQTPVVVLLDMHGNISPHLVEVAACCWLTIPIHISIHMRVASKRSKSCRACSGERSSRQRPMPAPPCCCRHRARAAMMNRSRWCTPARQQWKPKPQSSALP